MRYETRRDENMAVQQEDRGRGRGVLKNILQTTSANALTTPVQPPLRRRRRDRISQPRRGLPLRQRLHAVQPHRQRRAAARLALHPGRRVRAARRLLQRDRGRAAVGRQHHLRQLQLPRRRAGLPRDREAAPGWGPQRRPAGPAADAELAAGTHRQGEQQRAAATSFLYQRAYSLMDKTHSSAATRRAW